MTASLRNWVLPSIAAAVLGVTAVSVRAEPLIDPTRPPGVSAQGGKSEPAEAVPVLQYISISRTNRFAIISGQKVAVGGRYGEARVVRITEEEVILLSRAGRQVLRMYPNIDKRLVGASAPTAARIE